MNLNITKEFNPFIPTQECADWCIKNQIVNYNNMEVTTIMFVVCALFMIYAYEFFETSQKLKEHSGYFIYLAKILIYIFFFMYFIVLKLRIYYYGV